MLIVYVSLPPPVIVWEDGVILTVGALTVQTGELSVVVTALDTPFAWPDALAVTEVLSAPLVCAAFADTVRVELLLAPGDRVTDAGLAVEALKFVLFVSEAARLNVVFAQDVPLSLFLMLIVYVSLPPPVIDWEDGVILTVGALTVQAVALEL